MGVGARFCPNGTVVWTQQVGSQSLVSLSSRQRWCCPFFQSRVPASALAALWTSLLWVLSCASSTTPQL